MYRQTTSSISIIVEPEFLSEQSNTHENFFLYAYKITIENNSKEACQLLKRHWIIRDGSGKEEHVEGDGVIGKQPVIRPGERFVYTSGCPLATPTGSMRGSYVMRTASVKSLKVKVPLFFLSPPRAEMLHLLAK
jgi:ApaG protein